jgi:hypothetical protein
VHVSAEREDARCWRKLAQARGLPGVAGSRGAASGRLRVAEAELQRALCRNAELEEKAQKRGSSTRLALMAAAAGKLESGRRGAGARGRAPPRARVGEPDPGRRGHGRARIRSSFTRERVRGVRGGPAAARVRVSAACSGAYGAAETTRASGRSWGRGILETRDRPAHMLRCLNGENRWSLDGIVGMSKKFSWIVYRCEQTF